MNAYDAFASAYDVLNTEIDYEQMAQRICAQLDASGIPNGSLVLDLGCGTGTLTRLLWMHGYDMIGVDSSAEMLARARENSSGGILYLEQDITDFELYGTVSAIVSTTDTLNHITEEDDLRRVFSLAHNYLDPGGVFMFDLNSPLKFETVYGTRDYVLEDEGTLLAWQNDYDPEEKVASFYITLFEETKDGMWSRSDSEFCERCYDSAQITRMLTECGFKLTAIENSYDGAKAGDDTLRLLFVAVKG